MEQFLLIISAHFLTLLSPGPDFFLIVRCSLAEGWRVASGSCVGIALVNGLFILLAFGGLAVLQPGSLVFLLVQGAGCCYLLWLGGMFMRSAGHRATLTVPGGSGAGGRAARLSASVPFWGRWWCAFRMGFVSAALNPKNALAYASFASVISGNQNTLGWKLAYGCWMFGIVLLWDILVAFLVGNDRVLNRLGRGLPVLERLAGALLMMMGMAGLFWLSVLR